MGRHFVIEQAIAVMGDQAINVRRIGGSDAERGLKVLVRERETMQAIVRGADNDEQPGRCAFK